jgi:hypothetical protein
MERVYSSYLYCTDDYTATGADFKATGLSEYHYGINLLYTLMVSFDTKSIKSKIHPDEEEETAVVGDFEKGKELVIKFLNKSRAIAIEYWEVWLEEDPEDWMHEELELHQKMGEFIAETTAFLNARTAKYVLLENREAYDEDSDPTVIEHMEFLDSVSQYKADVLALFEAIDNGDNSAEDMEEEEFEVLDWVDKEYLKEYNFLKDFWKENLKYNLNK